MNAFTYHSGVLWAEELPLSEVTADVGTPVYVYSKRQLEANYAAFAEPFRDLAPDIFFANKVNPSLAVLQTLAACGAGAEVTSAGELERAIHAGVAPGCITFSGVGKRRDELTAAVLAGLAQITVESLEEMAMLSEVAAELGRPASIVVRLNPDVDAQTHAKLSTGHKETKFGIEEAHLDEAVHLARTLPGLVFKGLMVHVGSLLTDFSPFRVAYQRLADHVRRLQKAGLSVDRVDLGGGVGIPYDGQTMPPFSDYVDLVQEIIAPLGCKIAFEPGRRLVGDAGILVTRVVRVKRGATRTFVVLDAGMNDLMRPALYGARHTLMPVRLPPSTGAEESRATERVDVVGPVCETADLFGEAYELPSPRPGDLMAFLQAGAYGAGMASCYNGRPLVPEVLVDGSSYAVTRRRISVAEQMTWESMAR